MTAQASREEVLDWAVKIEELYKEFPWFGSVDLESDDGGLHIVVRVNDVHAMRDDGVSMTLPGVKTCIVCTGKTEYDA